MTTRKLALQALLRTRLEAMIQKTFCTVSPSDVYLPNWHISAIAHALEQCFYGNIRRLIMTMPPRSLKSICTSIAFPCWVLGRDPTRRIICASYSADLAQKFALDSKAVMNSDWYRETFPHTRLHRVATQDLITTRKGGRYATSNGGSLTGLGGDIIIIDDPMKVQDGQSEAARNGAKHWYDGTLYTRLNSKAEGVIILVMQRLHVDDLVAHVSEKEGWMHLDLPAIATEDQEYVLANGRRYVRREGEILHPEREPLEVLDKTRSTIGSYHFSAQYQQQPVPVEGNLVKWAWFRHYDSAPDPREADDIVQSWDTASKDTELADYSVCSTWYVKGNDFYLVDIFRERLDYPSLRAAVVRLAEKYRPTSILIEDTGTGTSLLQDYHNHQLRGIPYPTPITPKGDKAVRMLRPSAKIEAGHVHLPHKAAWLDDFKSEMLAFPNARHDDQVDSVSQFLNWYENRPKIEMRELTGL